MLSKLFTTGESSFLYRTVSGKSINDPWHFHKEIELVLINKGRGTRFVGDNVSYFEEGTLTLIGPNIPHLFRNDERGDAKNARGEVSVTYILFEKTFLGDFFFKLPEMRLVARLLEKSSLAIEITGKTQQLVSKKLTAMASQKLPERLLSLLDILVKLSYSKELKQLLTMGYTVSNSGDTEKINKVFEFIMLNYKKEIYIKEIASKVNMSVPSFSRYFKHHVRKTFSDYLTEIRISHACRLLIENNYSISEICYACGFENLSNFYRHFKKITGTVPKDYRWRFISQ